MQQKQTSNHPRTWLASFLVIGLVLCLSRSVQAGDCWGSWRFEISAPSQEKEDWLSPESWCRGARLPRTLAVGLKRDGESGFTLTGTPLQPRDLLRGGRHCEFVFAEGTGGVPKNHTLSIEVNESGDVVSGKARCSEKEPAPLKGPRPGITIDLAVTGSRSSSSDASLHGARSSSGAPVIDPRPAAVLAACKRQDGKALWTMMTPRFQSEVNGRAAQLRHSLRATDLNELYRHTGPSSAFTGLAYLCQVVKSPHSPDNPCSDVEQWEVGESAGSAGGFVVPIQRGDGFAFALTFTGKARRWKLDRISKAVRPPRP